MTVRNKSHIKSKTKDFKEARIMCNLNFGSCEELMAKLLEMLCGSSTCGE